MVADSVDLYLHLGLAIQHPSDGDVLKPVDHGRDVAEQNAGTVWARQQGQPFVFGAGVGLALRSKQDLAKVCLDRSAGEID